MMIGNLSPTAARVAALVLLFFLLAACDSDTDDSAEDNGQDGGTGDGGPDSGGQAAVTTTIGVFSDPHYYSPSLGTTGDAFDAYLASDRKMLAESQAIMESVTRLIVAENADVVLVPGDLTKDGVRQCHEEVAAYLQTIEDSGAVVLVVPGNHDIGNPAAFSYPAVGDPVLEEDVGPEEFESIYAAFGYDEAIARDPNSLSYVAEPVEGIWIIALDTCNYQDRFPEVSWVGGSLSEETLQWIEGQLDAAADKGVMVLGMMHHGIVEHYPDMEVFFKEYLLEDWGEKADRLAARGLQVVFTGHHHATDISRREAGSSFLFDVQTGSTATWQSPYRVVSVDQRAKTLTIQNKLITDIDYDLGVEDFQTYGYDFLTGGLEELILAQLGDSGFAETLVSTYLPFITPTLVAYYRGDEASHRDEALIAELTELAASGDVLGVMLANQLLGVWSDDTPDNNAFLDLKTGSISPL